MSFIPFISGSALKPEKVTDATNGLFGMVDVTNAYTGEVTNTPNKGFAGEDRFSFTIQQARLCTRVL